MSYLQQANHYYLLNVETALSPEQLFDIHFWQQQRRVIGQAKGRGITWFLQADDLDIGKNLALRHYYRGGWSAKFNRDRYFDRSLKNSRSFAEFKMLRRLHKAGLPVPQPIAARVIKKTVGYQADILLERVENSSDLTALLHQQTLSVAQWQEIGELIRQMHDLQVCHRDLNAHNILLQQQNGQQKFWLIDFDKCAFLSGDDWKQGNLERLHRSFLKEVGRMRIRFSEQNWQALLDGYHL
ncbi:3-deoxy-D-manno-octulosonic acid kinase [Pasteurella testudinis DSM 23072]|uniref:3-deoxy-D-manno-octulosonic acid kinase n=1 Tax=Pasteurella testudinis DSM 23072 TaxID=1122938 RepID=A0A1W1VAJ1_9PAST|nr:3-deoxy-D-manno-octulosonic acid kinase [Pasteurella testudinis]SMB90497.1 3-deoxy-D-manno-octulosonic acid kinase [Pasteurella testudinis DSM 23072]SUB52808.1 3-deoxy-D-manno-octulosonic acid kinase [Pasteurella testudinis]